MSPDGSGSGITAPTIELDMAVVTLGARIGGLDARMEGLTGRMDDRTRREGPADTQKEAPKDLLLGTPERI
jgi:hypothetical protein